MFTRSKLPLAFSALLLTVATLIVPSAAAAEPQVVDRQVFQTTGAEMALGMLADVRTVDVDRTGMTVTLTQAGVEHPVRVELAGLLGLDPAHSGGAEGGNLLRLGTLLLAAGILFRVVRTLARLGRESA